MLIQDLLEEAKQGMQQCLEHTKKTLTAFRVNKVDADMLNGISVDYFGVPSPIKQIATIKIEDARQLSIKPWEKNLVTAIERAIVEQNRFDFSTRNDQNSVFVTLPQLTEEGREKLAKQVNEKAEQGRVAVWNVRKRIKEKIKEIKSENEQKLGEEELQKLTDTCIKSINELQSKKKEAIMSV